MDARAIAAASRELEQREEEATLVNGSDSWSSVRFTSDAGYHHIDLGGLACFGAVRDMVDSALKQRISDLESDIQRLVHTPTVGG